MNYVHTALEILGGVSAIATALGNLMLLVPSWKGAADRVLAIGIDLGKVAGSAQS